MVPEVLTSEVALSEEAAGGTEDGSSGTAEELSPPSPRLRKIGAALSNSLLQRKSQQFVEIRKAGRTYAYACEGKLNSLAASGQRFANIESVAASPRVERTW